MNNQLSFALSKKPPDIVYAAEVLKEATGITVEQGIHTANMFMDALLQIEEATKILRDVASTRVKLTETKLALHFLNNPFLLEDIAVKKEEKGDVITYKNSRNINDIRIGYNKITYELIKTFGCTSIPFKTISEAILKATDWFNQEINPSDTVSISIIEVANTFTKLFRIPELKKLLPSLRLSTKEIELVLLSNGFKCVKYKTSNSKFFQKESDI